MADSMELITVPTDHPSRGSPCHPVRSGAHIRSGHGGMPTINPSASGHHGGMPTIARSSGGNVSLGIHRSEDNQSC